MIFPDRKKTNKKKYVPEGIYPSTGCKAQPRIPVHSALDETKS
jgi:hypothetical protein